MFFIMFYINKMISMDYGLICFKQRMNGFKRKINKMLGLKRYSKMVFNFSRKFLGIWYLLVKNIFFKIS